jgi:hypothetical protein
VPNGTTFPLDVEGDYSVSRATISLFGEATGRQVPAQPALDFDTQAEISGEFATSFIISDTSGSEGQTVYTVPVLSISLPGFQPPD